MKHQTRNTILSTALLTALILTLFTSPAYAAAPAERTLIPGQFLNSP